MKDKNLHVFVNGALYSKAKKLAKRQGSTFRAFLENAITLMLQRSERDEHVDADREDVRTPRGQGQ